MGRRLFDIDGAGLEREPGIWRDSALGVNATQSVPVCSA